MHFITIWINLIYIRRLYIFTSKNNGNTNYLLIRGPISVGHIKGNRVASYLTINRATAEYPGRGIEACSAGQVGGGIGQGIAIGISGSKGKSENVIYSYGFTSNAIQHRGLINIGYGDRDSLKIRPFVSVVYD